MAKNILEEEDDLPKDLSESDDILDELDDGEMSKIGKGQAQTKPQPTKVGLPAARQPVKEVEEDEEEDSDTDEPETQEPAAEQQAQTQDIGQYILAKLQELEERLTRMESVLFRSLSRQ